MATRKVNPEEVDIDLIDSFARIWKRRKTIFLITLIAFLLGIFVAVFAPETYKAECVFVPQVSQGLNSRFSSLASLAGISLDLSSASNDGQINPRVYPFILNHTGFEKELMETPVHFSKAEEPITLYTYFTDDQYHKFNLLETVAKYTIGLPRLLAHQVAPKPTNVEAELARMMGEEAASALPVYTMTKKEYEVARIIKRRIKLDVNAKKGYLTLTVKLPEAVASAEVCEATYQLIQKYVSTFKKAKSQANLEFIQEQLADAKRTYERRQEQLARFKDSNKGSFTARASIEEDRLKAECSLAQSLYSELAKNEQAARLKVAENTVTYTELSPVSVPIKRYSPKRFRTVVLWTLAGFLFGCCYVAVNNRVRAWKRKEE